MALYWPEANLVVTCEGTERQEGAWPGSALVIAMRPEQADDDAFVEAVRELVVDRTLDRRRATLDYILEHGGEMPEPTSSAPVEGIEQSAAVEAESRLRERLVREAREARDGAEADAWPDEGPVRWHGFPDVMPSDPLALGPLGAQVVYLSVGNCEELVVGR